MNNDRRGFLPLVPGLYAWVSAVFFGAILLDILYSRSLSGALAASDRTALFSAVSNVLLWIGFLVVIAAIGAIALSWNLAVARNLFIASLLVLSLEFFIPVFFSPFIRRAGELDIGPWLRVIPDGLASILAFAGLLSFYRQK